MALSTRNRRASAIGAAILFIGVLPNPDGTVAAADKQQLTASYAMGAASTRGSEILITLPFGRVLPYPDGSLSVNNRQQVALSYSEIATSPAVVVTPPSTSDTHDGFGNVGGPIFPESFFKKKPKNLRKKLRRVHREVPEKKELPQKIKELELQFKSDATLFEALNKADAVGEEAVKAHMHLVERKRRELKILEGKLELYRLYQEELRKEDEIILTILTSA